MNRNNDIFSHQYGIKSYDLDFKGKASIQSICRYTQDAADQHAFSMDVSVEDLLSRGLTWVLSRLHFQIFRYPANREFFEIKTWPSECRQRFALREFLFASESGEIFCRGTSSWMVLDLKQRRPIEIPGFILAKNTAGHGRAIRDGFDKLPPLRLPDKEKSFTVRIADLDVNQHVNNIRYFDWILEPLPFELHRSQQLTEIEVGFKAETRYPDRIISQYQTTSAQAGDTLSEYRYIHRLIRESDGKEVAVAVSRWSPGKP